MHMELKKEEQLIYHAILIASFYFSLSILFSALCYLSIFIVDIQALYELISWLMQIQFPF